MRPILRQVAGSASLPTIEVVAHARARLALCRSGCHAWAALIRASLRRIALTPESRETKRSGIKALKNRPFR